MKDETNLIGNKAKFNPFAGPELERIVHTTRSQTEIWTACLLGGDDANKAYNESLSLLFKGEIQADKMALALKTLVSRHESLRATFSADGRFMNIFSEVPLELSYQDFSNLSDVKKTDGIKNTIKKDVNHSFNLTMGPLLKAGLIKINDVEHQLILTAHHIICDGWSLGIMIQELGTLYSAYIDNKEPILPNPESFVCYADNQQSLEESTEYQKIEDYWLNQYKNSVPKLTLPTDFERPAIRTNKSQRLDFPLDPSLLLRLKKTGLETGCSLVTTLLAAFEVFLYHVTGQDDIVVGLPASGQSATGMMQMVGHCVNLLPLRSNTSKTQNFKDYLKERKYYLFDAYEHQQLSFGHLLQKLAIARDASRVPLVPVVFNIDLGLSNGVSFSGLTYELTSNAREYETFELFLNASGSEDHLVLEWSYNTSLFKASTIHKMMTSFEGILEKLVSQPNISLVEIAQINHSSEYEILNDTEANYPELALHDLLMMQAQTTPDNIAIVFKNQKINYSSLQLQANQFANYFTSKGIKKGDFIGVAIHRCPEMLAVLLALMQCGATYVPLDPNYPQSRLEFMLEDSEAKFLITTKQLSGSLPGSLILLEDIMSTLPQLSSAPLSIQVKQNTIAYLLYTSGSTGKPKGVPVTHKSLVNLLFSIANEPGINETDKFLAITTISFDIAWVELFLPLLKGACIVLADTDTARDGQLLLNLLKTEAVTILQATPTTWQMLLDANWEHPLKLKAFCGGEALSANLAQQLLSRCDSLWNMYGPTETTIYSIIKQIFANDKLITIGKPIANTQVYILDEKGHLVRPGTIGEIAIGGHGVAAGYWKRPNLTSEKFIENPFDTINNKTLYRTGDLGRLLKTDDIQCLGRVDQQVKIRGHRIEPGEIEQSLINIDGIQNAVVLAHGDRLVAHIVPLEILEVTTEKISSWRKSLSEQLPTYLLPQEFRILKTLPKTPNGKLDRQVLFNSERANIIDDTIYASPRTNTERLVLNVWKECLDLNDIDIFDDFFQLGGHSLIAVKVMSLLEKHTGKRLPLSSLFQYSTVEKLATLLDMDSEFISWDSLVPIKPEGSKTPLYIVHGAGLNVLVFKTLVENLDKEQPVYGLQAKGLNGIDEQFDTIEEIAAHYIETITKVNPKGPYALAGYSLGGIIAYEMAIQLAAQGKDIKMLGLLDTNVEPYFYHVSPLRKRMAMFIFRMKRRLHFFKEMTESWGKAKFHLNRKKEFIFDYYIKPTHFENEQHKKEYQDYVKTERMIHLIMKRYHLIPHQLRIDLFRAKDETFYIHEPQYLGWKDIPLKGLHVHDIPGDHLNIFSPPNDREAAHIIQTVLNQRNAGL
jgi:amino acid adenylation domain-containing protein